LNREGTIPFEVIIIDVGTTDSTLMVVRHFDTFRFRYNESEVYERVIIFQNEDTSFAHTSYTSSDASDDYYRRCLMAINHSNDIFKNKNISY